MTKQYKKCRWGHTMENAKIYNGTKYCATCKKQRAKYDWYNFKCKSSNVTDGVVGWEQWATELWGKPMDGGRV